MAAGIMLTLLSVGAVHPWGPAAQARPRSEPIEPPADLSIVGLETSQVGYRAGDSWVATVTVQNVGDRPSGPFSVLARLAHTLAITPDTEQLPDYQSPEYSLGSSAGLAPGESVTLTGSPHPLADAVVPIGGLPIPDPSAVDADADPALTSWVPGIRNYERVYLRATLLPGDPERDSKNHVAVTTFRYPVGPPDPAYEVALDGDKDGWLDGGTGPFDDCDDGDPEVYPGAVDLPNDGVRNCCCGPGENLYDILDNNAPGWNIDATYPTIDNDGDGYPAPFYTGDYYAPLDDCNDSHAGTHPFAIEYRNGKDDDCDNRVDELVFVNGDVDDDGVPPGWGDCNDHMGAQRPAMIASTGEPIQSAAPEVDDGLDNDCDGLVDEGFRTPDWVLSNFEVERTTGWIDGPARVWGLRWEADLANKGEDLGPASLRTATPAVQLADASTVVLATGTSGFAGIVEMQEAARTYELACDRTTVLLAMPEGTHGEVEASGNLVQADLEPSAEPVDIVAALPQLAYERGSEELTVGGAVRWEPGSCPVVAEVLPPIAIRTRVILNGEQILDVTEEHVFGDVPTVGSLAVALPERLHRLDEVRVDVVANLGRDPAADDPSNNRATTVFQYRTPFLGQAHLELLSHEVGPQ